MKLVILALFVRLACRVHCGLARIPHEAVSSSGAMDSSGWNHGVALGVQLSPGIEGMHQRPKLSPEVKKMHQALKNGEALELEFNRGTGAVTKINRPCGHQQTNLIAPYQPPMQRKDNDEVHRIVQGLDVLLNGQNSEDTLANSLVPIEESDKGVHGFCGQIKVYDSENPDQLLLQSCCQVSRGPGLRCRCTDGPCLCLILTCALGLIVAINC